MNGILYDYIIVNRTIVPSHLANLALYDSHTNIYEVLRITNGVPLFFEDHLERCKQSAKIIGASINLEEDTFLQSVQKITHENRVYNGNIKMSHYVPVNGNDTNVCALFFIPHSYPDSQLYETGVKTILFYAERNNPNAKVLNKALREKVDKTISDEKIYETIYVDSHGNITEGSRSNIFIIKNNTLLTAPASDVLKGITRKYVLQLALELGMNVSEAKISMEQLQNADAVFLSGTSPKILPINAVDNTPFDVKNSQMQQLMLKYNEWIELYIKKFQKK